MFAFFTQGWWQMMLLFFVVHSVIVAVMMTGVSCFSQKKFEIQSKKVSQKQELMEKKYFYISQSIFPFVIALPIYFLQDLGLIRLVLFEVSLGTFLLQFILFSVLFDAYFYWAHRLMHTKYFAWIHVIHHISVRPTVFTSYSLSITEAVLLSAFLPLFIFIYSFFGFFISFEALVLFFVGYIFADVYSHSNQEWFPSWWITSPYTSWVNTSVHHNMHHQNGTSNFGLYFSFWDKFCATMNKSYEKKFHQITKPKNVSKT